MFALISAFWGGIGFLGLTMLAFVPYALVLLAPLLWLRHLGLRKTAEREGLQWGLGQTLRPIAKRLILAYLVTSS